MTDKISQVLRSKIMRSIKSSGTRPELLVRSLVFSLGYRYRLTRPKLPGRPDLIFPGRKKVIFVHGCFWHGHFWSVKECRLAREPAGEYWKTKLVRNVTRDLSVVEELHAIGWDVLIIWECQLANLSTVRENIVAFLGPPTPIDSGH